MLAPSDDLSKVLVKRRGGRAIAVLVGVSLLSGGVGWVASRQLQSPADVAARTNAPNASRIVAPLSFGCCVRRCLRVGRFGLVRLGW
jgi:hypothetical protein